MSYPNILVATDLSEPGNWAFAVAEQYRQLGGGVITPLHTLTEVVWPDGIRLPAIDEKEAGELLNSARLQCEEAARKHVPKDWIEPAFITYGDPAQVIIEKSPEFDLIVLSTYGRTGFKKFMIASVAEKVCKMSKTPVLVTQPKDQVQPFRRVLLTTDFSKESTTAFKQAYSLLENTNARFDLVHVVSLEYAGNWVNRDKIKEEAEKRLKEVYDQHFRSYKDRVSPAVIMTETGVHRALHEHIQKHSYDLIIISATGKGRLDYMLLGSTSSHIIKIAEVPVLTVQPQ